MGHRADFICHRCHYEERDIAIGHGRQPLPFLALFSCSNCHSVGSSWVGGERPVRCSFCYDEAITILADDTTAVACPKCQEPAYLTHRFDDVWE